jgi:hypothetical protein
MATINIPTAEILEIKTQIAALMARLETLTGGAGAPLAEAVKSGKAPKKSKSAGAAAAAAPEKKKRQSGPTAWSDFTAKILAEHAAEKEAFVAAAEKKSGAHLTWLSNYKAAHADEWEAFQKAWVRPARSAAASEAGSDSEGEEGQLAAAEAAPAPEKKKRVLSEEQKAKMQAGRQAAAAAKKAAAAPAAASNAVGGGPAVELPAAAAAEPESEPESEDEEEGEDEEMELLPFQLGQFRYLRPGVRLPNGQIRWTRNSLWENNKGTRGDWVGELDPVHQDIDASAEEPELDE